MSEADSQIEEILNSGYMAAAVIAGGGSGAVEQLLTTPGASSFILEVQIPYSVRAMFDYLGKELSQFCSSESAEIMADRAFERALGFSNSEENPRPVLGVACTAALATDRERRGKDRAYLCIKAQHRLELREITFDAKDRKAQEDELSTALLNLLAEFVAE